MTDPLVLVLAQTLREAVRDVLHNEEPTNDLYLTVSQHALPAITPLIRARVFADLNHVIDTAHIDEHPNSRCPEEAMHDLEINDTIGVEPTAIHCNRCGRDWDVTARGDR